MGDIVIRFATAFRDYSVQGVPASGAYEPDKAQIRAIGAAIETGLSAVSADIQRYATVSAMEAVTDAPTGQLAQVYNNNGSTTDPANGTYQWNGTHWVPAP